MIPPAGARRRERRQRGGPCGRWDVTRRARGGGGPIALSEGRTMGVGVWTERIPQGHGGGGWAAQGLSEALILRRWRVWLGRGLPGVNAPARVQRSLRRQHNMETHGSRCCETCFRHSVLGRRRLACRRCRPARAWGVWGVSPLPQFAAALARAWPARPANQRAAPLRGAKAQGGNSQREAERFLEGCGEV